MNFQDLLITEDCTLLQAMERLDKTAKKTLFVAENEILQASVTDGDIRRWILSKGSLDAKAREFANYKPRFAKQDRSNDIHKELINCSIDALPIVNDGMKIIDIVLTPALTVDKRTELNLPVVIQAGGRGVRLYPYTKILPKPLIPIGEIPIVEHIINGFCKYGCNDYYMIVNYKKNMIKAYFNDLEKNYTITFADENIPLGTGGGIGLLKGKIDKTFILTNCDVLITEDFAKILAHHKRQKNLITMICCLKNFTIPYGVIETDKTGHIEAMKEKPLFSFLTNTGCYIVEPEVLNDIPENTSIGFPDIAAKYMNRHNRLGMYPISENNWMDMGQFDAMKEMERKLGVGE